MGPPGSDLKGTQPRWGHRGVKVGAQGVENLGLEKAEAEYKELMGTVTGPWWQRGRAPTPPPPHGSRAPVVLVSLHLLQVGATPVFHLLQSLAPARGRLPARERAGQRLQPSRLLGHRLLQLCPKQQGLRGWGRHPGAEGRMGRKNIWDPRRGPTPRPGPGKEQPCASSPPRSPPPPAVGVGRAAGRPGQGLAHLRPRRPAARKPAAGGC